MHRVLKAQLYEKRFSCPIEGCEPYKDEATGLEGYTYEKAVGHQKTCQHRRRQCRFGCGQKVMGFEAEAHEQECPEKLDTCENCQCPYKINAKTEADQHDCIEALKKVLTDNQAATYKIKETYGLNYDVMNNKCRKSHPLVVHVGLVRSYNGIPRCDECRQTELHEHEFFYRCDECDYDLCRACALCLCDPPVLKEKIKTSEHNCLLERRPPNHSGGWNCDVSHQEGGAGIRCESAIPGYHKTKYI